MILPFGVAPASSGKILDCEPCSAPAQYGTVLDLCGLSSAASSWDARKLTYCKLFRCIRVVQERDRHCAYMTAAIMQAYDAGCTGRFVEKHGETSENRLEQPGSIQTCFENGIWRPKCRRCLEETRRKTQNMGPTLMAG